MTPHELNVRLEQANLRNEHKFEHDKAMAYVNAKLARVDKFPTFEKAFETDKRQSKPQKQQTPEEMMAVMSGINT